MFGTDIPSTINFSMPNWLGGISEFGGTVYDHATYYTRKGLDMVANPLQPFAKGYDVLAEETSTVLKAGSESVKDIAAGLSTGAKWAGFLVVAGLILYAFAMASPFIPRPRNN